MGGMGTLKCGPFAGAAFFLLLREGTLASDSVPASPNRHHLHHIVIIFPPRELLASLRRRLNANQAAPGGPHLLRWRPRPAPSAQWLACAFGRSAPRNWTFFGRLVAMARRCGWWPSRAGF
jgi:hypothetical protein